MWFILYNVAASQEHPAGTSCTLTWWTTVNKKWDDPCRDLGLSHFFDFLGECLVFNHVIFWGPNCETAPCRFRVLVLKHGNGVYMCENNCRFFLWAAMYGGCLPDWLLEVKGHHVCFCFHVQIYVLCWIPTGPNGTHPEVRVYTVCVYIYN